MAPEPKWLRGRRSAGLRCAGDFVDDIAQHEYFDAVIFVLPRGLESCGQRLERGRLTQANSVGFDAVCHEKLHRLLAAFEAQLPMVAIAAVLRERATRRMGSQLDPVLFTDQGGQYIIESFLSFFGEFGGAIAKVNNQRRQVAVGGEQMDVLLLLPDRGGSGLLIGGVV